MPPHKTKTTGILQASSVGFATPGYNNSVLTELESGNEVSIQPEVFTPNGDGLDDFTLINYNFSQSGYVVNVTIFDAKGRLINQLVRNETPGLQGFYKWDGLTDEGEKARSGLYIILVDLFDLNGNRKKLKKEVAIGL
jgi:flagellar hook assembly protein FlgD